MAKPRIAGRLVDVRPDRVDLRDRPYLPALVSLPGQYPEPAIRDALLPRYCADGMILDQGAEGACTGFGLAAVVNYLLWSREVTLVRRRWSSRPIARVSPRMLYHLARVYDEWPGEDYDGSSCRGAMKGWHRHGVCNEEFWPYARQENGKAVPVFIAPGDGWATDAATRPLGAYYRVDKSSVTDMQAAINEVGAIYASADVHRGWNLDRADQLPIIPFRGAANGGHAFALVGYDANGFIVQNSWGEDWGFRGFATMTYEDWTLNGMDAWVATMGAPIAFSDSAPARSENPLRDRADRAPVTFVGAAKGARNESKKRTAPWNEGQAYRHTMVIGNDGRALNRLVDVENAVASIASVVHDRPLAWLSRQTTPRIAIYAHGGLNDEEASVNRIRVLAPYFLENGVYPLFFTWRTGVRESISGMLEDELKRLLPEQKADAGAQEVLDRVKDALSNVRDRTLELAAERLLVKGIWSQMKQNAAAAVLPDSAAQQSALHLGELAKQLPGLRIHLVGHSAGGILHGHFLTELCRLGVAVDTVSLFAPACTMEFAVTHYGAAMESGALARNRFFIEMLADRAEQNDCVGPYGKSLLYLVCRALEVTHKTPILGMEIAWQPSPKSMQWEPAVVRSINQWRKLVGDAVKPRMLDLSPVADCETSKIPLAHGSFDNDLDVITRLIKRVSGNAKLVAPVDNLRGY
jgi:hypothetical protein